MIRRDVHHRTLIHKYISRGWSFKSGYHPQCGGLAATGWAEDADEFAIGYLKADVVHRNNIMAEMLSEVQQGECSRDSDSDTSGQVAAFQQTIGEHEQDDGRGEKHQG